MCSLWNARLFPLFKTRRESANHAVGVIKCLKENEACSGILIQCHVFEFGGEIGMCVCLCVCVCGHVCERECLCAQMS